MRRTRVEDTAFAPPDAPPEGNGDETALGPIVTCMADCEPRKVEWLWPNRFPMGRLSLIVGNPGVGKSFVVIDVASRITTGSPWPDGSGDAPRGSVLLITAEDDPHDTIRPRLDAHRADVERVHLLSGVRLASEDGPREVMFTLADSHALRSAADELHDLKAVVIDPIGSFIGSKTDAHRDNEVRAVLAPVARFAEEYGAAVIIIAHRRKGFSESADDSALGSRAFTGIARAVWHLSRDPHNRQRRLLLAGKNNLAPESDGLAFTIGGDSAAVVWEKDAVLMSADEAIAEGHEGPGRPAEERSEAIEWLRGELADFQEHATKAVKKAADDNGIAWRTCQRAAKELRVIRHRATFGGGMAWRLPKPGPSVPQSCQRGTEEGNGTHGTNGTNGESP